MSKRTLAPIALFCLVFGASVPVGAQLPPQDRTFSPQLFHPAVGPDEFFTVQPARPLEHLNFSLGLWMNYSLSEFAFSAVTMDSSGKSSVGGTIANQIKDNLGADLVFALGLWNRLQLGVGLPVTLYQTGDSTIFFPTTQNTYSILTPPTAFAMGDPWIDVKVRLLGADRGFNLALSGFVTLPLSQVTASNFGGDPDVSGGGYVLGGWEGKRWRVGAQVGFLGRGHLSHYLKSTIGHQIRYAVAGGYDVIDNRKLMILAEVHGHTDVSGVDDSGNVKINALDGSPLEVDVGVKIRVARPVYLSLGVGTGFIRGLGAPVFRGFGGLTWAPDRRDRDKDGVPDTEDLCPDEPEDRDGYKDDDGCPDPDNDGDGLPDAADKCPDEAEDFDGFKDNDGCPEPDNDGDGIPDIKDACPLDKEDGRPPRTADGCPFDKVDTDEDGVPDAKDKCPLDPEDKDGFADDDGCPDVDNDEDGIPDSFDKCPNEAEDKDGFADDDGCPDKDNDEDGVPDERDRCPLEPETVNGFQDEDGCPDRGPPLKVQIVGDEIVILEKVFFKTGKAIIEARSHNLLDQMTSVLRLHPEIKRVLIEGHTDSKGNAQKNLRLSQDRADAVKLYLVKRGTALSRLEAKGFGSSQPVADNKTDRGREANRRVQFKILEQEKKPAAGATQ